MKEFVEKLIGRLENRIKYNELCHKEFPNAKMSFTYEVQINAYKNAIEIVNQLAEEYNNGWIPCSERLPIGEGYRKKIDGVYYYKQIVTTTNDSDVSMCIGWYDQEDKQWYDIEGLPYHPIAWMPPIEPYQKGE